MHPVRSSLARYAARGGITCSLGLPAILLLALFGHLDSREIAPLVTAWLIASVIAAVLCTFSIITRPNLMAALGLAMAILSLLLICAGSQVA